MTDKKYGWLGSAAPAAQLVQLQALGLDQKVPRNAALVVRFQTSVRIRFAQLAGWQNAL